jgi:hypothetical protein
VDGPGVNRVGPASVTLAELRQTMHAYLDGGGDLQLITATVGEVAEQRAAMAAALVPEGAVGEAPPEELPPAA